MEGVERVIMIKREDIDDNILISLNKRDENWQIVEDIKNDLNTQKEDYVKQHDLKVKNEIFNGNFNAGMSGWAAVLSDADIIDGVANITATGKYGGISAAGTFHKLSATSGDKVYFSCECKSDSTLVSFALRRTDSPYTVYKRTPYHNGDDWGRLSEVGIITDTTDTITVSSRDSRAANWTTYYIDNIIYVNLTQMFGKNNEPTKEEMDMLIDILGGWFDGEITLSQKQLALWTLNMIRQNRNAIVALGGTIV